MRKISDPFIHNLKTGFLSTILDKVHRDKDLDLHIRDGYINIYLGTQRIIGEEPSNHHGKWVVFVPPGLLADYQNHLTLSETDT